MSPEPRRTSKPRAPRAGSGKGRPDETRDGLGARDELGARDGLGGRDGLGARASKLVEEAALILEEELAMGIDVARNVEQRLFGKEPSTRRDPEAVVQRFRRDAHDIVDLAVDVIGQALSTVGSVADRTVRISEDVASVGGKVGSPSEHRTSGQAVPTLAIPRSIAAGESAEIEMQVENDSESTTESFQLNASDLISDEGGRIPARNVKFEPATLQIPAHRSERITVRLRVPVKIPPGTYSGLLQATKLQPVRAVLVVKVA